MKLLAIIKSRLNLSKEVFTDSEEQVQTRLAPQLRAAAIHYLRHGQGVVAKNFRGEYVASGLGTYESFLQTQSRPSVWGTYIEACALAEMLGCHLVVTPVTAGITQKPLCLYRTADPKAPTIHLFNSNNTHWYINDRTQGDGNCLYNAIAQALRNSVQSEQRFQSSSLTQPAEAQRFFSETPDYHSLIQHQQEIESAIAAHPTPQFLAAQLLAEQQRISKLPLAERQQIAQDYQLALALAREALPGTRPSPVFSFASCQPAVTQAEPRFAIAAT